MELRIVITLEPQLASLWKRTLTMIEDRTAGEVNAALRGVVTQLETATNQPEHSGELL